MWCTRPARALPHGPLTLSPDPTASPYGTPRQPWPYTSCSRCPPHAPPMPPPCPHVSCPPPALQAQAGAAGGVGVEDFISVLRGGATCMHPHGMHGLYPHGMHGLYPHGMHGLYPHGMHGPYPLGVPTLRCPGLKLFPNHGDEMMRGSMGAREGA